MSRRYEAVSSTVSVEAGNCYSVSNYVTVAYSCIEMFTAQEMALWDTIRLSCCTL